MEQKVQWFTIGAISCLSLDPPFVDWWTLFGFNTGGGPCRAWCVGAGACRGSGWWVVGGLSTAGLSGVRQVLV